MTEPLPPDVLALLDHTREIQIETRVAQDVPPDRTTIWVVVDDDEQRALIRTFRGPSSRWYRRALDQGVVTIVAEGREISVSLERAADAERIAACSAAIRAKYGDTTSVAGMLAEENLPTTLELRTPTPPAEGRRGEGS
jgi:hypothetical protein